MTVKATSSERKAGDEQQLSKLAQALGIGSIAGEIANPYDKLLSDENTAAMRAHRDVTVAEARLNTIKAHRDRIQQLEIDSKVQEMAASSPETTPVKQQLLQEREASPSGAQRVGSEASGPCRTRTKDRGN